MDQEDILRILEDASAGEEVAEHETELPKVFISDLEVYRRLMNDEIDLITGGKGTGKTAIYRMITETKIADDLIVLPASNPTGAPEFRALFTGNDSEERLRSIWAVYFASIIGNHVVDSYGDMPPTSRDVQELRELLELTGLRRASSKLSLLDRIRRSRTVEGGLSGAAVGIDVGASLKFELPEEGGQTSGNSVVLNYPDFFSLIQRGADILRQHGYRLWIAIDRLDECFVRNSVSERRALRGLLRAALDCAQALQYTKWIRIKIFLRSDLFSKFTEDGAFTNATHLRRNDISWTFNSMADLIAHRLTGSEMFFNRFLKTEPPTGQTSEAWEALMPQMGERRDGKGRNKYYTTSQQLCIWTADGSKLYNPRNLIALTNLALLRARENQRRALSAGRAGRAIRPLVEHGEVIAARGELSRRRLDDTVINEFPSVAPLSASLRGGPHEYSSADELARRLGFESAKSPDANEAISTLLLSGLLGARAGRTFSVPVLYRAALTTTRPLRMPRPNS